MNIYNKSTLIHFWEKHHQAKVPLQTWYKITEKAKWKNTNDVKKIYGSADAIGKNRMVFNIKGNDYRLIVAFNFQRKWVFIKFIGTHKEYDKIDASTI
ncbi:MAG: type II toxin-antitoxin system HigB family toxin [Bacteroidetes bacterium]|nr:type II toxin-antitoxin system HigB family toxin [Bacteroidota bacterium]